MASIGGVALTGDVHQAKSRVLSKELAPQEGRAYGKWLLHASQKTLLVILIYLKDNRPPKTSLVSAHRWVYSTHRIKHTLVIAPCLRERMEGDPPRALNCREMAQHCLEEDCGTLTVCIRNPKQPQN